MTDDMLEQIYNEMDIDNNGVIDVNEFIDFLFKTFKNCEDNIEFLSKDIKGMEEKMTDVRLKFS